MPTDLDPLTLWIADLHARLNAGDFDGLAPFELGHGTGHLPGETTIRIMLADLADLENPSGSARNDPGWQQRRLRWLLEDFRELRELIG